MKIFEIMSAVAASLAALSKLAVELRAAASRLAQIAERLRHQSSYETLLLDVELDIRDRRGRRAIVNRRQRVQFLREDTGVIRELVWGEGEPLAGYSVQGAQRLGVRREGSRRVILLGLPRTYAKGERALVTSRRLIRGALTEQTAYAEMFVERRTRRIGLKVLFPKSRPPRDAHLTTSPATASSERIRTRYGPEGRPYLVWKRRNPERFTTYSLNWRW